MKIRSKIFKISAVLMLIMVSLIPVTAKEKSKAGIKFEQTSYNFNMIKENGGPVSHEFTFVNDGNANLVIYDAKAECGCTTPEFPKEPIAPGKTGKIKVTYNPLGRPGGFTKVITVKTNGSPSKVNLKIQGTVKPK